MMCRTHAQYGHVERVSLARAIFSVRSCATRRLQIEAKHRPQQEIMNDRRLLETAGAPPRRD